MIRILMVFNHWERPFHSRQIQFTTFSALIVSHHWNHCQIPLQCLCCSNSGFVGTFYSSNQSLRKDDSDWNNLFWNWRDKLVWSALHIASKLRFMCFEFLALFVRILYVIVSTPKLCNSMEPHQFIVWLFVPEFHIVEYLFMFSIICRWPKSWARVFVTHIMYLTKFLGECTSDLWCYFTLW